MPYTVQPKIRAIQEVLETKTMIRSLDTRGITIKKAQESAGTNPKLVPKGNIWYLGTKTVPA